MRWLWLYEFKPEIGGLISKWYENHPLKSSSLILWDGRNKEGKKTPEGLYFLELRGEKYQAIEKIVKIE